MKIKRILFYVISVLVCFLLQTSVFEFLKLADVMPNILLILTVTIAFIRGKKAGIVVGFVCGLLIDIFSGSVLWAIGICISHVWICKWMVSCIFL